MKKFSRNGHHKEWKKRWKNLVKEDFDWDYNYLDNLVIHKLELMLEYYSDPDNVAQEEESRLQIVNEIKECLDLFDKALTHDYNREASEFFVQHCLPQENPDEFGLAWRWKWDNEENYDKWLEMEKQAEQQEQEDIETAYRLIGKYRAGWWD